MAEGDKPQSRGQREKAQEEKVDAEIEGSVFTPGSTSVDPEKMGVDVDARAKEHPDIDRSSPGGIETASLPYDVNEAHAVQEKRAKKK